MLQLHSEFLHLNLDGYKDRRGTIKLGEVCEATSTKLQCSRDKTTLVRARGWSGGSHLS